MRIVNRLVITVTIIAVLIAVVAGCTRNPEEAKLRYVDSGQRYFDKGEYESASIQFRKALKFDPRFAEAHFRLGLTNLRLRLWRDAFRAFSAAVGQDPNHREAHLGLAELLLLTREAEEARAHVVAVQTIDPENLQAQTFLAQSYMLEENFPQAVEEFEKAKQLAPQSVALWLACGLARVGARKFELAERDFRRAIELEPSSPEAHRNLANLFRLTGRQRKVQPLLRTALASNPRSLGLLLVLADFYFQVGSLEKIDDLFADMKVRAGDSPNLGLKLGDFWMWRNEPLRAAEEYEAGLAEAPSRPAQKNLISTYLTLRRLADAERLNQSLLEMEPRDLEARTFRGALASLRNDFPAAIKELQEVVKRDPFSVLAHYYLGMSWMGLNKVGQAKAAFMECVRLNEHFSYAYLRLAELALRNEDWQVGSEYAQKVLELNPRLVDGYLQLAQAQMLKGDLPRAELALQRARELPSPPAEFYEVSARLYALKDDDAAALSQYEQALAKTSQPFALLTRYADFHVARGRADAAVERVKRWMESVAAQPSHYELLARLYLQQRDFDNAELAARKALELGPERWAPHFLLGQVYQQQNLIDKALERYDESIRRSPRQIIPYFLAGNLLMNQGRYEKAKPYFEAALGQDPDSSQARHALARWYAQRNENLDLALSMAQELRKQWPENPHVSDTLGWIYYQKGLYDMALDQLRPAARALPDNALVQFHLGMAYLQTDEAARARQALERAIRLRLTPPALAGVAERTLSQLAGG